MSELVIGIAVALELAFVVGLATWLIRRKRRGPSSDVSTALARFLPEPLARVTVLELEIWVAMWRLIFSRRQTDQFYPADRSIHGRLTILIVITAPVILWVVYELIPSTTIAWIVTGVSAYGIFWNIGVYASIRTTPHSIDVSGLILRYGILGGIKIPWNAIESVVSESTKSSKAGDGLRVERVSSGDYEAWLMSAGQADATIGLNTLVRPRGVFRLGAPVRAIHVAVERPDEFVSAVQFRLMTAALA